MKFSLSFLVASNLLTLSLTWFYTAEVRGSEEVVEPVVEEVVKAKPVFEYQSKPGCSPCVKFKNSKAIQRLEAMGYEVIPAKETIKAKYRGRLGTWYPTFRITTSSGSSVRVNFSNEQDLIDWAAGKIKEH